MTSEAAKKAAEKFFERTCDEHEFHDSDAVVLENIIDQAINSSQWKISPDAATIPDAAYVAARECYALGLGYEFGCKPPDDFFNFSDGDEGIIESIAEVLQAFANTAIDSAHPVSASVEELGPAIREFSKKCFLICCQNYSVVAEPKVGALLGKFLDSRDEAKSKTPQSDAPDRWTMLRDEVTTANEEIERLRAMISEDKKTIAALEGETDERN